jgi:hypothetical protein
MPNKFYNIGHLKKVTPVANTLAYYDTEKITAVKGVLIWAPVANIINFLRS